LVRLAAPRVRAVAESTFALRQPDADAGSETEAAWAIVELAPARPLEIAAEAAVPTPGITRAAPATGAAPDGGRAAVAVADQPSAEQPALVTPPAHPALVVVPAVLESEVTAPTLVALGDTAP
jgi:hypothetical protein